jgi:hypothetical protein
LMYPKVTTPARHYSCINPIPIRQTSHKGDNAAVLKCG